MQTTLKSGTTVEISWNVDSSSYDVYIDTFLQSNLDLNNPKKLNLPYAKRLSVIVGAFFPKNLPLSVLHLGAGALSFVEYLSSEYPGSSQTAVEIEEDLIDYIYDTLPLRKSENIDFIFDDAIKVVKDLAVEGIRKYDLIVSDFRLGDLLLDRASNVEYYSSMHSLLSDGGLALVNAVEDQPLEIEFSYAQYKNMSKVFDKTLLFADEEHIAKNKPTNILLAGHKSNKSVDNSVFTGKFDRKNLIIDKNSLDTWKNRIPNLDKSRELEDLGLIAKIDKTDYLASKEDIFNIVVGGYVQSNLNLTDPSDLNFENNYLISKIVDEFLPDPGISVLHLGGGGMTMLRCIKSVKPNSKHVVVEVSRDLIKYVSDTFPLTDSNNVEIVHADAKAALESLSEQVSKFDLIISDVKTRNFSPKGLYDEDFYTKVASLLSPNGILALDLVDTWRPKEGSIPAPEVLFNASQIKKFFKFFSAAADLEAISQDSQSSVLLFGSNSVDLATSSVLSATGVRLKMLDKPLSDSWASLGT